MPCFSLQHLDNCLDHQGAMMIALSWLKLIIHTSDKNRADTMAIRCHSTNCGMMTHQVCTGSNHSEGDLINLKTKVVKGIKETSSRRGPGGDMGEMHPDSKQEQTAAIITIDEGIDHFCPRQHIMEKRVSTFGTCDVCHCSLAAGQQILRCNSCQGFAVCSNCTQKTQEPNLYTASLGFFENGAQLFDSGDYCSAIEKFQKSLEICEKSKMEKWDIPQQVHAHSAKYIVRAQLKIKLLEEGMDNIQKDANFSRGSSYSSGEELRLPGVSVYHLQTTFMAQLKLSHLNNGNPNIHEIENLQGPPGVIRLRGANFVCLIDGKMGAAYVNCLEGEDNVGEATHMLSYSWSYKIGDIVDSLSDYCMTNNLDPKRTYIWICCLCINQHRVVQQKECGGTGMLNFEEEFPRKLKRIGHMLAMMAPWRAPFHLTRLWCVFEMYAAHANGCKVDIVMPPQEKVSLEQDVIGNGKGINALYEALGNTNVQNADATVQSDKKTIMGMIESTVGCQVLNNEVNKMLRGWMKQVLLQLVYKRGDANEENYATYCSSVGVILFSNGEYESALEQYQKCLGIRESVLGLDHPKTAATYNKIGLVLSRKGDHDSALEQFAKCLEIQEVVLGANHPQTAVTYNNIGLVLSRKGDFDGALEQYRKCLAIQEVVLGTDHPSTATSYDNIGSVVYSKGDYNGALEKYWKCLAIREVALGIDHPHTAATYNNIGLVLSRKGDHDGALEQYWKCLAIQEDVVGTDHIDTASTYNNIGAELYKKGDYDGALEHHRKSLDIQEVVLGTDHPDIAITYKHIGNTLGKKGDYDDALKACMKSHAVLVKKFGKDHPDTKSALDWIQHWSIRQTWQTSICCCFGRRRSVT